METIRNALIAIRQWIKRVYAAYGVYLNILAKWAVAYTALTYINQYFPGRSFLLRPIVVIAISLLCSVLPWNYISLFAAVWLLLQLSALSLEATVYLFIILLVLALLRYLTLPGVSVALVLLPIFFIWKIPFVIPVLVGLIGSSSGFITVGSGVAVYYLLQMLAGNMTYLTDPDAATLVQRLLFLVEKTIQHDTMLAVMIAFCLTTLVVYLISRLSLPYAPQIAVLVGAVFNPILLKPLLQHFSAGAAPENVLWGSIAAFFIGLLFSVFSRFLDYSGTERVQFEDDEYYYYVKAVPKLLQPDEQAAEKRRAERKEAGAGGSRRKAEAEPETPERRSRGNAERRSRSLSEIAAAAEAAAPEERKEDTNDA